MIQISMREFTHHLSEYIKKAERGEKVIVTRRAKPAVQISYYNEHVGQPTWKKPFRVVKMKGEPLSQTIIKMRREE